MRVGQVGKLFKFYKKFAILGMVPRPKDKVRLKKKGKIMFGPPVDPKKQILVLLERK